MENSRIGFVAVAVFLVSVGITVADGVDHVWKSGGAWSTSQVSPTAGVQYQAITRDGTRDQTFAVARADGGVDIHNFSGTWGTDWQVGSPVVYTALDAWGNKQYDYLAARADGGFDEIYYGGSWLTWNMPINGVPSPSVYNAVATDDVAGVSPGWEFFAAKAGGGMDMFLAGGPGWNMTSLAHVGATEYVAMTSDINQTRTYYAAKAGGGIDMVTESTVGELPGTAGLQYVSLAADKGVDDRLYGVKADGSIEIIYLSGGTWLTEPVPTGGILYAAVDTRTNTNDLYAVEKEPRCGDIGTLIYSADLNQDCYVDLTDLAGFVGQWLWCSDPNDPVCQHQGPGPNNSYTIAKVPVGGIVVDGNLSEWPGNSEWISLDKLYWGDIRVLHHDILDAKFTARWDGSNDKIYVAVIIDDNEPNFSNAWINPISSDRIEIYSQGDAAGGQGWGDPNAKYDVAQQYALGPDTVGSHWVVWGNGAALLPDTQFESAVTVNGTVITYECAVKQFDNYGTISGGSTVVTQLQAGITVGFDIVLGTMNDDPFFMMLAENYMTGKFDDADKFQRYELVDSP